MFAHLHVHSPFSFLDGASSISELFARAAAIGCGALAVTDHDTVASAVRFRKIAHEYGVRAILGCEITLAGGHHLTLLCRNKTGYANLCRLLTHVHLDAPRGQPCIPGECLAEYSAGLVALSGCRRGEVPALVLQGRKDEALSRARFYADTFPGSFYIELQDNRLPRTVALNNTLAALADHLRLPLVATANAHYATAAGFPVHDILTCVRTLTTLESVHPLRRLNAENYLLSAQTMQRRFRRWPQALHGLAELAESCEDALPLGENLFPDFRPPGGGSAAAFLRQLAWSGARERYGRIDDDLRARLEHELSVICRLGVAAYFLVAWDIARFAREQGIRYAGRGSAADSAVAYCLYITEVDSYKRNLLFARFLSLERAQKPDIDIDFDARRRDDVARYVYATYGEEHVASVCTYHTYHARSVLRDFGKAMGFPPAEIDRLAKSFPHIPADGIRTALRAFPELAGSDLPFQRYDKLFSLCEQVAGFPRHIGTHLGGLVISSKPINQVSPLQMSAKGVAIIQFDKDDIEDLGLIKLDLLSLRTMSAIDVALTDISAQRHAAALPALAYQGIPADDPDTYAMINSGRTIGVFQLESPAQRVLQSMIKAENIEDIVASIALIRPGPIKGNMVEPFIARRRGQAPVTYVHPALEPILAKTYGVVLYQEQVIEIATTIAGFTPGEADQLRKSMTRFRSQKAMDAVRDMFLSKAFANGVDGKVAETIYSYIVGYAGYGFCEAHAAAFSDTAYKTAYLIKHYPAEFFAAILSNQPMGYYPPRIICAEAKRRGVRILPLDINHSDIRYTATTGAMRVSLTQARGVSEQMAESIVRERSLHGAYASPEDFVGRTAPPYDCLAYLVTAGAFDALYPNRKQLLWRLPEILSCSGCATHAPLPMAGSPPATDMPDFTPLQKYHLEVESLGYSPTRHIMQFIRPQLPRNVLTTCAANVQPAGARVTVAGQVFRPHRPPTRSGRTVVFFGLEDEHGSCEITVFEEMYHRYGRSIFTSPLLSVQGKVERRGESVAIVADYIAPISRR